MAEYNSSSDGINAREQFFANVFKPQGPEHKIYDAIGNRPTFWGCDRELFMSNILICLSLVFLSFNLFVIVSSILLAFFVFFLLVKMGERDDILRFVYIRQLKYRPYYIAQGNVRSKTYKRYPRASWL